MPGLVASAVNLALIGPSIEQRASRCPAVQPIDNVAKRLRVPLWMSVRATAMVRLGASRLGGRVGLRRQAMMSCKDGYDARVGMDALIEGLLTRSLDDPSDRGHIGRQTQSLTGAPLHSARGLRARTGRYCHGSWVACPDERR